MKRNRITKGLGGLLSALVITLMMGAFASVYADATQQLATPVLSMEGMRISWTSVQGATRYNIYVDGVDVLWGWDAPATSGHLQYLFDLDLVQVGSVIRLRAISGDANVQNSELSNSMVVNPAVINTVTVETAEGSIWVSTDGSGWTTPSVAAMHGNIVNLAASAANFSHWEVVYGNVMLSPTTSDNEWVNASFVMPTVPVRIRAVHQSGIYAPAPDAPVIVLGSDGFTLSWDRVTGHYDIYVDGEHARAFSLVGINTPRVVLDLRETLQLPLGTYQIQVRSRGWANNQWISSVLSNAVTFTQLPPVGIDRDGFTEPNQNGDIFLYIDGVRFTDGFISLYWFGMGTANDWVFMDPANNGAMIRNATGVVQTWDFGDGVQRNILWQFADDGRASLDETVGMVNGMLFYRGASWVGLAGYGGSILYFDIDGRPFNGFAVVYIPWVGNTFLFEGNTWRG